MSAPQRVSKEAIRAALVTWRGDISAAAHQLGISRNALYDRVQRIGLDLAEFRPRATRATVEAVAVPNLPIKTAPRKPEPLQLRPDLRDRLLSAVWALQARFQAATSVNLVLEQLVEEKLGPWLEEKLGAGGNA